MKSAVQVAEQGLGEVICAVLVVQGLEMRCLRHCIMSHQEVRVDHRTYFAVGINAVDFGKEALSFSETDLHSDLTVLTSTIDHGNECQYRLL